MLWSFEGAVQSHLVTLGNRTLLRLSLEIRLTSLAFVITTPSVGAGNEYYIRYWLYVTSVPNVTTLCLRQTSRRL